MSPFRDHKGKTRFVLIQRLTGIVLTDIWGRQRAKCNWDITEEVCTETEELRPESHIGRQSIASFQRWQDNV